VLPRAAAAIQQQQFCINIYSSSTFAQLPRAECRVAMMMLLLLLLLLFLPCSMR
jgi:stress response protein SCP2